MNYKELIESIVNNLLEAPLVRRVSAEDAEKRAAVLAQRRASGQGAVTPLYSDPQRNAEQDPLLKPHHERLSFLKKAIEDGFVTNKVGERKPIGPRIVASMQDEISKLEKSLGTGFSSETSRNAEADLKSIFGPERAVSGSEAFDHLFKR